MPLLLSELQCTSKEIPVTYDGKTFHVTYNPSAYNGEFMEQAEDEFLWKTLEKLLVPPYWDLVTEEKDEKGKTRQVVLPLDPTLKKMPWGIVSAIYFAIRNDVYSPNSVVTPPTKTESTGSFG